MVQIRIKKTLSEGLLYVIICSKEINKPEDAEAIKMNEFNEYVREVFSVHFGLSALVPKAENLICNGVVIVLPVDL